MANRKVPEVDTYLHVITAMKAGIMPANVLTHGHSDTMEMQTGSSNGAPISALQVHRH